MSTEKFLKERARDLKRAMEAALSETNRELCKIQDCPGTAMSSTAFCEHHWSQELARHEEERERERKKRAEMDPNEVMRGQALAHWFQAHRQCVKCGKVGLRYEEGKAVYDPDIPNAKRRTVHDGIITLCNQCLAEIGKKKK